MRYFYCVKLLILPKRAPNMNCVLGLPFLFQGALLLGLPQVALLGGGGGSNEEAGVGLPRRLQKGFYLSKSLDKTADFLAGSSAKIQQPSH
jgi:hypothetical protein